MHMPLVLTNRRRRGGAPAFSPSTLYSSGSQGIWLDPSDLSTMFSDRAGTTPVTAPGTVVGLRLDKSKGLVLGAELVGGVWSGTGNAQDGTVFSGDDLEYWATEFPTVIGRSYRFTATLSGKVNNSQIRFRAGISGTGTALYSSNNDALPLTVNILVVATSTTSNIEILFRSASASVTLSNISVRELPGNHAVAPTDAARPIYGVEPKGGRRNLLTYSEDLTNAIWGKAAVTSVTPTPGAAPDGTSSADLVLFAAAGRLGQALTVTAGATVTATIRVKRINRDYHVLAVSSANTSVTNASIARFNLQTLALETSENVGTGFTLVGTPTITALTNGYVRLAVQVTVAGTAAAIYTSSTATTTANTASAGAECYFAGAQLELGSTATNYQRTTTAYDVTESGVATTHYVQYDGSDDSLSTSAIDFTGTDKMSVFAGVRKLSDAARGMLLETSSGAANGSFSLQAPNGSAANNYEFNSIGTSSRAAVGSGYVAPISNVLTGLADIAAPSITLRVNGSQAAQSLFSQGTGNYGNHALFIGRRGGTSLPFNGRDYGIIVVGKAASAGEISDTETWLAARTAQVTL